MKKTILLLLLTFVAWNTNAKHRNESDSSNLIIGVSGGAIFSNLNTDGFNNLIPSTLPALHKNFVSFTGAFNLYPGNSPLYTNFCVSSAIKKQENAGVRLEENLNFFDVNFAYDFLMQRKQSLYAALGVGQLMYQASYYSDQPNLSFSGAAAGQSGERSFRLKPLYYLNVKGGYSHRISKKVPFSLGLEGGYRIGLNNRPWALYDNSLSNSPKQNASGAFVSLSLIVLDRFGKKK
ncbi:MAG: hypothetical protein ABI378_02990 [Chitinophagaceae bacterium]